MVLVYCCFVACLFFLKIYFMFLKGGVSGERERERPSPKWPFGWGWPRKVWCQEFLDLPCECRNQSTCDILHPIPKCINRQLDQKWSSHYSNCHPKGIQSTVPEGWPWEPFFFFFQKCLKFTVCCFFCYFKLIITKMKSQISHSESSIVPITSGENTI